ncbi:MAG TPA: ParB/RepB/Spo0J family partition protein [Buttiauxella sp.]|jgi:ParB family chromosome partitioning protein
MSVTRTAAKTTKKSTTGKAGEATAQALKTALAATDIELLPLSSLVKSPLNVRTIPYAADSIRELADSIAAVGLLQNLVVHALDDGHSGVAAGGRRLTAMMHLVDIGTFSPDQPVAVKRVPDDLAVIASLTENGQRRDMHPAEQIVGFRTLTAEGKTPAQIGDLLGYGARHVQRMLKLADLAPVILEALAQDELTTEHCHALALESDPARQVLEAARQKGWNNQPEVRDIRSLITESEVTTDCAKFRFVGEAAFTDGEIRRDLFSADEGGFVDAVLLDTRVLDKLAQVADDLKTTEGWSWCLARMEPVRYHGEDAQVYVLQEEPDPVYSEEEEERLASLQDQYEAFDSECDESVALALEIESMETTGMEQAWTQEMKDATGVVVSWSYGAVTVQRGVQLRDNSAEGEQKPSQVHTYTRQPEPADSISRPLVTKMSSERTLAVQAALMEQQPKSIALLAWTLCLNVFSSGAYGRAAKITLDCKHYSLCDNAPSGKNGAAWLALIQEQERLSVLLPTGWAQDFTTFFTLSGTDLLSLLSFCTAASLDGVQTREHGSTSRSPLDGLESALDFHLRDWWQPTADNFLGLLSKTQIVDALTDAGLTGAARNAEKMKKGDAAEYAESQMSKTRWVPAWMAAPVTAPTQTDTDTHAPADAA